MWRWREIGKEIGEKVRIGSEKVCSIQHSEN
jgi:hypothetical protein